MLPLFHRIYWKLGMDFEIKDNFLIGAKQQLSPNSSDRTNEHDISLLIIHNISLPPGVFGTGYVDQFFCNNLDPKIHPYFQNNPTQKKFRPEFYINNDKLSLFILK